MVLPWARGPPSVPGVVSTPGVAGTRHRCWYWVLGEGEEVQAGPAPGPQPGLHIHLVQSFYQPSAHTPFCSHSTWGPAPRAPAHGDPEVPNTTWRGSLFMLHKNTCNTTSVTRRKDSCSSPSMQSLIFPCDLGELPRRASEDSGLALPAVRQDHESSGVSSQILK